MKKSFSFSFFLFTLFLIVGYSTSTIFYKADYRSSNSTDPGSSEGANPIHTLNNGQRSILLVGVDAIKVSDVRLESLWLATYLPADTNIHMLPIFPAGNQVISDFEIQLYRSFSLSRTNGNLVPGQNFINVLEENNFWWSGYFVFDQVALSKVMSLPGLTGTQSVGSLTDVLEDHQKAFSIQLSTLQSMCQNLDGLSQEADWSLIGSLIPDHVLTDLDIHTLNSEWEMTLSSGQNLHCRFPTLQISRLDP